VLIALAAFDVTVEALLASAVRRLRALERERERTRVAAAWTEEECAVQMQSLEQEARHAQERTQVQLGEQRAQIDAWQKGRLEIEALLELLAPAAGARAG
jgi:hypothetical protein